MMALGKVERTPVEEGSCEGWSFGLEDMERALPFLAAVGAYEVEVMPVGGDLAPEVGRSTEGFPIEELVLDEAVNRFDIALPGVALGRDVTMLGAEGADGGGESLLVLVFEELRAVVGLPGEGAQVDAVTGQVDGELFRQESGVALGEFIGVAGKGGAGNDFTGGVLEAGQLEAGHLEPVMRDVLQILGISRELAEEFPMTLDRAELLFGDGLFLAGTGEAVLTDDAGDGVVTAGKDELVLEALGAEAGLLAQLDDLTGQAGRSLMGT